MRAGLVIVMSVRMAIRYSLGVVATIDGMARMRRAGKFFKGL